MTGLGVYRMWRDARYGFSAILIGVTADLVSIQAAFYRVAVVTFVSGGIALVWMRETQPTRGDYASEKELEPSPPGDDR